MAIKINLDSLEIPVEIGGLSFVVYTDDDSVKSMYDSALQFYEELKAHPEEDFEFVKDQLSKAYDAILGIGAFDKIYAERPSTRLLVEALVPLANGIVNEFKHKVHSERPKRKPKRKKNVQLNR